MWTLGNSLKRAETNTKPKEVFTDRFNREQIFEISNEIFPDENKISKKNLTKSCGMRVIYLRGK